MNHIQKMHPHLPIIKKIISYSIPLLFLISLFAPVTAVNYQISMKQRAIEWDVTMNFNEPGGKIATV